MKVDAKTITYNNFEGGGGWSNDPYRNNPDLVEKGQAHSGQYAIKVDKDHDFSLTYDMALGKISPTKFKTLHLEAWAFMPTDKATGALTIQLVDHATNKEVFSDGIKFRDAVKSYNKWVAVSKDIMLPDNITPDQHLRLFLHRADATETVLVDDVKLSIKD
jgi:hypothetical protein